jgi:regulator of replication initiation timing
MNDQEYFASAQSNLRGRLAEALKEISALNTRVGELSAENFELKFKIKDVDNELKDTRAILGQAVVNANRQVSCKLILRANLFKLNILLVIQESGGAQALLEHFSVKASRPVCPQLHRREADLMSECAARYTKLVVDAEFNSETGNFLSTIFQSGRKLSIYI